MWWIPCFIFEFDGGGSRNGVGNWGTGGWMDLLIVHGLVDFFFFFCDLADFLSVS